MLLLAFFLSLWMIPGCELLGVTGGRADGVGGMGGDLTEMLEVRESASPWSDCNTV